VQLFVEDPEQVADSLELSMDAWAKAGRKHLVVIYYMIGGNVTLQKLTRRPAPWNGSRKVVLSNASLKSRLQVCLLATS
jgi:hypothetical protein